MSLVRVAKSRVQPEVNVPAKSHCLIGPEDASPGPAGRDCFNEAYVFVSLKVEAHAGPTWTASGSLGVFFREESPVRPGEAATVEELEAKRGYKALQEIKQQSGETSVLLEDPIGRDGVQFQLFEGMEGGKTECEHVSFYPRLGLVHKSYCFHHVQFPAGCHGRRLRVGLLLELNAREVMERCIMRQCRLVASPLELLARSWSLLLPGVALQLYKPISLEISRSMAARWSLGPAPSTVQGVDFSGAFSPNPLYVVLVERRGDRVRLGVVWPSFVLGILSSVSLSGALDGEAGAPPMVRAIPAAVGLLCHVLLRCSLWHRPDLAVRGVEGYFVATLFAHAAAFACATLVDSASTRGQLFGLMLALWIVGHLVFVGALRIWLLAGAWEGIIASAKRQARVKPGQEGAVQDLRLLVPMLAQSATEKRTSNEYPAEVVERERAELQATLTAGPAAGEPAESESAE